MLVRADNVARRLAEAIERRWLIGAIVVFVVVCAGMAATLHLARSYTTEAKLAANAGVRGSFIPIDAPAEIYAELLTERAVAERVTADLRLQVSTPELLRHVVVHRVGQTPVLALDVSWSTPEMSAKIANHLAESFVESQRELIAGQSTQSIALIAAKLPGAVARQKRIARALADFQSRNRTVDMATSAGSMLESLTALDVKSGDGEVATASTQRTYAQDPNVVGLRSTLAAMIRERDAARAVYRPSHPVLVSLERSVAQLQAQIASNRSNVMVANNVASNSVVNDLSVQRMREQGQPASTQFALHVLHRQWDALARTFAAVPQKAAEFATLQREAQLSADAVAALEQKSNEAVLARYSAASDVAIVQTADAQAATVIPNVRTNLIAALVVGAVLALVAVLAIEFFDDRIRNGRDLIGAGYALPVLATIPNTEGATVATLTDAFGELLASLRENHTCQTLVIVSPLAGDGKSTVALALARTLGEIEPGVLLVDGDLRDPTLHERVNRPRDPGLSDVLCQRVQLADVIESIAPGVHFISSGSSVPNTLTLLQSAQFDEFLSIARSVYRIIVIDAPGLEPVMDGAVIAAQCDAAVLVVASNRTSGRSLRFALQRLNIAGTSRVAGVVFNSTGSPRKAPAHCGP